MQPIHGVVVFQRGYRPEGALMASYEVMEAMVRDCLRANPRLTIDDLLFQQFPDGSMALIERTRAMKWLDWQSDNHGWGMAIDNG